MISGLVAKRSTYAGLFLITLTTLMHELLLTRIFSVTMWYHFAFVAISVAMFGMTVGALIVYLMPDRYAGDKISSKMAGNSVLFGFSMVFSLLMHLVIPFAPDTSLLGLCSVGLTYAVIGVPFVFSGIVVCLALTKFPSQVSRLYAVDLAGAAVGCVLFIYLLDAIDAPSATLFIALTATIGGLCFAIASGRPVLSLCNQRKIRGGNNLIREVELVLAHPGVRASRASALRVGNEPKAPQGLQGQPTGHEHRRKCGHDPDRVWRRPQSVTAPQV
jgi:hypothetical protein